MCSCVEMEVETVYGTLSELVRTDEALPGVMYGVAGEGGRVRVECVGLLM